MVRSVLYLRPLDGDHTSIKRFFEEEGVLERASKKPGFVSAELHAPVDGGELTLVTALWESEEAYRGWVEDPWRDENAGRAKAVFEPLESESGGGSRYEVTIAVTPSDGAGATR